MNLSWLQFLTVRRSFLFTFVFVLLLLIFNLCFFYLTSLSNNNNNAPTISEKQGSFLFENNLADRQSVFHESNFKNYDLKNIEVEGLTSRVQELLDIRSSVLKELRSLERNRSLLIQSINDKNFELENLKSNILKRSSELERIQLHIKQAVVAQKEAKNLVDSLVEPPLNLLPQTAQRKTFVNSTFPSLDHSANYGCQMYACFDYSRCSLFSPFYVYIYNVSYGNENLNTELNHEIYEKFKSNFHVTENPNVACIYVLLVWESSFSILYDGQNYQNFLNSLPFWGGDGRNNLIINMNNQDIHSLNNLDVQKAIVVQNRFEHHRYRNNYDILIPNIRIIQNFSSNFHHNSFPPLLSPAKRKYFLTYLGRLEYEISSSSKMDLELSRRIKKSLLKMISKHSQINHNELLFDFDCDEKTRKLCDNQTIILLDSTFSLIPVFSSSINDLIIIRLFNSLVSGSIPVIISEKDIQLPFEEVIDWSQAVIKLPLARVTELYVLLKTFSDADLIEMKRFGSYLFNNYFSSIENFVMVLFSFFGSHRLQIPAPAISNEKSNFYYNQPKYDLVNNTDLLSSSIYYSNLRLTDDEENLGPIEPPLTSLSFRRNYTLALTKSYHLWNDISLTPFYTFPSLPFDTILPSESKFIGSSYGFRPISNGLGGSGREFSESLGGNFIREQFTIVILTYEREKILLETIARLKNLPYLNKVIVVWNSPSSPSPTIKWPDIGVDIVVIKSKRNSLNNRFLPYDEIKTDAILSIDDDTSLRHDEIIFAFRVWREARDRIVGFPARFHSWDTSYSSWFYNSSHTCEYSMILTGASFFHKYYSYLYTYSLSPAIRDKVDEYMNCEDIAMNFLVSHLTRKPPIKVTSRWTFRCPACQSSLSEETLHFEKRHKCLNYFVSIFSYMPLLNTQFRADSVLFKTRVPHDKQKCFKYI